MAAEIHLLATVLDVMRDLFLRGLYAGIKKWLDWPRYGNGLALKPCLMLE